MDYKDSWKNKELFDMQLELNMKELHNKSTYPRHWMDNIELMVQYNPKSILDVGCGCGAFYEVCRREFENINYLGIDYSKEAIDLAKKTWGDYFKVLDYKDLTEKFVEKYDMVYLSALLDVLPNGDEALEFILSLNANQILISRVKLINEESRHDVYKVYNGITTYAYYHNYENFINNIKKYNYSYINKNDNFYLTKI